MVQELMRHAKDDEHLYRGFDASQAGGSKPGGLCSSGPLKEYRQKVLRKVQRENHRIAFFLPIR